MRELTAAPFSSYNRQETYGKVRRNMAREITRSEAWDLLTKYNQEPFHLQHAETVSAVMGWYADKLGYGTEKEFWQLVGLLHDLDYEKWPEQHCEKTREIMEGLDLDPRLIRAIVSHGYGHRNDVKPEHEMEKVLYATDELTGLIGAVALIHPNKQVGEVSLKSLKKKYKTLNFAAGCSRDVIEKGADMLGWPLEQLLSDTLDAMKAYEAQHA